MGQLGNSINKKLVLVDENVHNLDFQLCKCVNHENFDFKSQMFAINTKSNLIHININSDRK